LAALLVLSPWVVKNLYFFGQPFYQIAVQVSQPQVGSVAVTASARGTVLGHIWWLIVNLGDIAWHSLSPLCVLLILAPFLFRRPSGQGAMLFLLISGVLWLIFVPRFIEPRYYVAPIAVGEILIAALAHDLLRRLPIRAALADLPLIIYLLPSSLLVLSVTAQLVTNNQALTVAAGGISRISYLSARVRPYQAEIWINEHTPAHAEVASVGVTRGYFLDRSYLADWYGERLSRLEGDPATRRAELAVWCRSGVRYVIFDRGRDEFDDDQVAGIHPLPSYTWVHTPGLAIQLLFSARGVDVLSIRPCR
jgi:hypothetical protein